MLLWNATREEDQRSWKAKTVQILDRGPYSQKNGGLWLLGRTGWDVTEAFRLLGYLQNRSKPYALKIGMWYVSVIWS